MLMSSSHGARIMRTGGGFTYLQSTCRHGSSLANSNPLFLKVIQRLKDGTTTQLHSLLNIILVLFVYINSRIIKRECAIWFTE